MTDPRVFVVTSPGYTATKWLAWALSRDPRVACTHSSDAPASRQAYSAPRLAALATAKFKARDAVPLCEVFARWQQRASTGVTVVGNVHGYNLTALRRNEREHGAAPPYAAVNLVRHPVPWLESGAQQLGRMVRDTAVIAKRLRGHARANRTLYRELRAPSFPWDDDLAFCYLCGRLPRLVAEAGDDGVEHVQMEALTARPEALAAAFEKLTALPAKPTWVSEVIGEGALHRHRLRALTPQAQLDAWPPWRQRVFHHWAQRCGLAQAYEGLGYHLASTPRRRQRPPAVTGSVGPVPRAMFAPPAAAGMSMVSAWRVPWSWTLGAGLRNAMRQVRERWHGGALATVPPQTRAPMSPGVPGIAAQLGPRDSAHHWHTTGVHPIGHDRSPAIVVRGSERRGLVALSYKGAGIRSLTRSFVVRANRCPQYLATLSAAVRKPIDVLFDHPSDEWRSHELVGGARLVAAIFEARHALGWHALGLAADGEPVASSVPLRMWLPRQAVVGDAPARLVPLWRLFGDPTLVTDAQLRHVARAVFLPLPTLLRPRGPWRRQALARAFQLRKRPVIYEHATRAKLRVGHLWSQLLDDAAMRARAEEIDDTPATVLQRWVHELYDSNGRAVTLSATDTPLDGVQRRFAYLREVYQDNEATADVLLDSVGRAAGRTLGLLHGAGGHCLGRRVKVHDEAGHEVVDRSGLALRMGAPGGGCTAPRNATVAGEWVDTVHLFNPRVDSIARLARFGSTIGPTWFPWAADRARDRLQRSDVRLAEESMTKLDAIVTGNRELVGVDYEARDELRARRKRLEDQLARDPCNVSARDGVLQLEARTARLRARLPSLHGGPATMAFVEAYELARAGST